MSVTRADVAKAASVSPALVSYVLNGGPRPVSSEARERVLQAVAELGYRPDGNARYLKLGTTRSLGFVLPDIRVPSFATLMQLVTDHAFDAGKQLLVAASNASLEAERKQLIELAERRVSGVLLMSVEPEEQAEWAGTLGMPVLLVDRPQASTNAGAATAAHLIEHGHTRIAFVQATSLPPVQRRRLAGATAELARVGLSLVPDETLFLAEPTGEGGYHVARQLFERTPRIDAVVLSTEAQAHGFIRAAEEQGVRIPEDVAVMTFEAASDAARFRSPTLSSVNSPLEKIARQGVERLLAAESDARFMSLDDDEYDLVLRESCGCVDS